MATNIVDLASGPGSGLIIDCLPVDKTEIETPTLTANLSDVGRVETKTGKDEVSTYMVAGNKSKKMCHT